MTQTLSPRQIAAIKHREEHAHACTAEIPFSAEELEFLENNSRAIFTKMPPSGPGFECYDVDDHRYGRSSTVQAVLYICQEWEKLYPQGPRIGVGDLSMPNGGNTPRHATHEEGVDVDFSVVTNNGKEEPSDWRNQNYSQSMTQEFVDLAWNNPILPVSLVFFNDPQMRGVQFAGGHDNHLHIRFQVGENIPSVQHRSDDGVLKLVSPYMKGNNVAALQEGLAKAGIAVDVDSVFGKDTERAVKAFQEQHGLEVDGVAGPNTLAKLGEVTST